MVEPLTIALYAVGIVTALFIARGLWILYHSGNARIEQKKALVKAKEGRNPEDAMTYHQEVEAKAIEKLSRIPLIGRIAIKFKP